MPLLEENLNYLKSKIKNMGIVEVNLYKADGADLPEPETAVCGVAFYAEHRHYPRPNLPEHLGLDTSSLCTVTSDRGNLITDTIRSPRLQTSHESNFARVKR